MAEAPSEAPKNAPYSAALAICARRYRSMLFWQSQDQEDVLYDETREYLACKTFAAELFGRMEYEVERDMKLRAGLP